MDVMRTDSYERPKMNEPDRNKDNRQEGGVCMKSKVCLRKIILMLALAAVAVLFLPAAAGKAEAAEYQTEVQGGQWKWSTKDGERYGGSYARLVNKNTGKTVSKGWHVVDDYWFYFEAGGYVFDEFHDGIFVGYPGYGNEPKESEYTAKCKWVKVGSKWRYKMPEPDDDGNYYMREVFYRIDGKIYYFDKNGDLYPKGWRDVNDEKDEYDWIYVNADGSCKTGWMKVGSKYYFFDYYSGAMVSCGGADTSPIGKSGAFYAFNEGGVWINGTGWIDAGNDTWFYATSGGKCVTGWKKLGGKWYYFDPIWGAEMAYSFEDSLYFREGYYIRENGTCGDGGYKWHKDSTGWWYGKGSYYVKDSYAEIDGIQCEFNKAGYVTYFYDPSTGQGVDY